VQFVTIAQSEKFVTAVINILRYQATQAPQISR